MIKILVAIIVVTAAYFNAQPNKAEQTNLTILLKKSGVFAGQELVVDKEKRTIVSYKSDKVCLREGADGILFNQGRPATAEEERVYRAYFPILLSNS